MNAEKHIAIALVGYGRMGKEIHKAMRMQGYPEPIIIDPGVEEFNNSIDRAADADVCIEFTRPEAAVKNLLVMAELGKPIVCGTTGWSQDVQRVQAAVLSHGGALIQASNFSVGVHMLNRLTALAASMLRGLNQYDIAIHEVHHRAKADAPSGTALTLAETILRHTTRKTSLLATCSGRAIEPQELCVSSERLGYVIGRHEVAIDSEADSLRIVHEAKNRVGFAEGALMAARWIQNKKGIFSLEEMFDDITGS